MSLIKRIIGFNSKRLFIGKVGVQKTSNFIDKNMYRITKDPIFSLCISARMIPTSNKAVLLERNPSYSKFSAKCYKSAFGKEFYGEFGKCTDDMSMVAEIISPALPSNYKSRIKYSDAKKLEEKYAKTKVL